jgi:hypothetical protein
MLFAFTMRIEQRAPFLCPPRGWGEWLAVGDVCMFRKTMLINCGNNYQRRGMVTAVVTDIVNG